MERRKLLGMGLALLISEQSIAQDWNRIPGGNIINATEWLGADVGSTVPLRIETRANQPIDFFTAGDRRSTLTQGLPGQTVNGIGGLDLTGFLGVGDFDNTPTIYRHPVARVHVDRSATVELGYRSMIRDGFLATQGEMLYYGGLLDGANAAGLLWSRSTGTNGVPGTLRFIYTGTNQVPGTVASGTLGLELGRFQPANNLNEGFFGIGDWTSATATPDERLDVLDRTIRVRRLVPDYRNDNLTQVVMVDANGRLHWKDIATFPGGSGTDCRWGNGVNDAVVTAVNGVAGLCRDQTKRVGIGTANPGAKLDVYLPAGGTSGNVIAGQFFIPTTATGDNYALKSAVAGNGTNLFGVHSRALVNATTSGQALGVYGEGILTAGTAPQIRGVYGYGQGSGSNAPNVVGVFGHTIAGDTIPAMKAVHGRVQGATSLNDYAGFFEGRVWITGPGWVSGGTPIVSDANLKTNVASLTDATTTLSQLQPRTYNYDVATYGYMGLPSAPQIGLMAQEVEQVLPGLVQQTIVPAEYDSLGNVLHPETPIKGIDYVKLVPLLIAGFQEQQVRLDQQSAQIQQLQQQLSQCCTTGGIGVPRSMEAGAANNSLARETDLRIIPNPVAASTQLRYTVATEGRVRLEVSDAMGRLIEVLEEGQRTTGEFTFQWNTSGLAPGTYYCTLLVNEEPLVKRAVKLNER